MRHVLIGSWLLMLTSQGCAQSPQQLISTATPTPDESAVTPTAAPGLTERDQLVLDRVLRDLLSAESGKTPVSIRGAPPETLSVASSSLSRTFKVFHLYLRHHSDAWSALPTTSDAALRAAADDLVARAAAGFSNFVSTDPRVTMVSESDLTSTGVHRFADRPIRAWPPGYSPDGSLAVVFLNIPWSMHSTSTTYVLALDSSGWNVVVRQFIYHA